LANADFAVIKAVFVFFSLSDCAFPVMKRRPMPTMRMVRRVLIRMICYLRTPLNR